MNYLYGDSTASDLKSNFLEFLRDALDFGVTVLEADARIKQGKINILTLTQESEAETERLDRFIASVSRAVHSGEKGEATSPTAACGERLSAMILDAHRSSVDGIKRNLNDAIARIDDAEAADRSACVQALGTLLAPHDPPRGSSLLQIVWHDSRYVATLSAKAEPSLEWTLDLGIPDGSLWSSPLRVERMIGQQHLEIRAPQLTGWLTKEVKIRPLKIERHVVTLIVDNGDGVSFKLRTEPGSEVGFDFEVDAVTSTVAATRTGPADDQTAGPFDLHPDDMSAIVELANKLRASLAEIERTPSIDATFEGTDFGTQPSFVDFVEKLVGMMAPIVREISQRSLTPNELVLRRLLGNDRREEIFVAKSTLREKLASLPQESRDLFAPLGLDGDNRSRVPAAPAAASSEDPPPIRSELPPSPSAPPPAPVVPPPPAVPSIGTASPPASTGGPKSTSPGFPAPTRVKPPVPQPPSPPSASKPRTEATAASDRPPAIYDSDAPVSEREPDAEPQVEFGGEIEITSFTAIANVGAITAAKAAQATPALPSSDSDLGSAPKLPEVGPRNEALVAALKKIMMLSRNGRAAEAYDEYTNLFSSDTFTSYRPEDQRQALKLMVLAKSHPTDVKSVTSAHSAALPRIKALVEATSEAADQELLGVTHLFLGDTKAAGVAFKTALDAERTKNPGSELIASLMKRVSQI
jgi:hypothetical protein